MEDLTQPSACYSQQLKSTNGDPPPTRPHLPPPLQRLGTNLLHRLLVVEAENVDELEVGHRWWILVAVNSKRMAE